MKNKYFHVSPNEKENIITNIRSFFENRPDIGFIFLHGSFVTDDRFKDIDVAVYLNPPPPSPLQSALELETELGKRMKEFPVDVRILNGAPLSFRYNVIKHGQPILVVDDDLRSEFVETTLMNYFDFYPFLKNYLKEAFGSGIQS